MQPPIDAAMSRQGLGGSLASHKWAKSMGMLLSGQPTMLRPPGYTLKLRKLLFDLRDLQQCACLNLERLPPRILCGT